MDKIDLERFYRRHRMLILVAIVLVSVGGSYFYNSYQQTAEARKLMQNASTYGCGIEYSQSKCIDGDLQTAFFNPGGEEVTYVEIRVPVMSGTNVYRVEDPLPSNETGTLTTASCSDLRPADNELRWCCGEVCFQTDMANPSDELEVKKAG
ncbi:MAG: hypothetical protein MUP63_03660 [Candidatus Nanohaloarchaeota archaeon QJJ-7]|nr:hypothetical protein [Candidatus Nanohaloarchaeota archaeon QJJ-7]